MPDGQPAAESAALGQAATPQLERRLGVWDVTLLTIGSMIGTGIFLTTGDMARVLPRLDLILLVWLGGGLLTVAGALTYGELGAMFPRAGGIYHFLKEAYGPLWGFLFGWTAFTVIMSGGIAALSVGFGEYLGSFFPLFSTSHTWWRLELWGGAHWVASGGQIAGVAAILVLTTVNYLGLREGVWIQNLLTLAKVGAIAAFVIGGFLVAPTAGASGLPDPLPPTGGALLSAFGLAMIAALWTYDGWYGATFSAGEMRRPERVLPLGLVAGTLTVATLYAILNLVYARALSMGEMAAAGRIGEAAASALFGAPAARWISAAVVVSTFGCLSATILYSSRIYLPMAADGVFFRAVAKIHPRHHTPGVSLWAQSSWAIVLALSGRYDQLYTYVTFASVLFMTMTGAAVFVLRRTRPDHPRPYRTWGYPWVPLLFIGGSLLVIGNTLLERPTESLLGLGLVLLGLPAYAWWRHRANQGRPHPPAGSAASDTVSAPGPGATPR
jgi:APA family basic amino acid/polyamine antiporter